MSLLHLLEPEETAGNAWHRLVGGGASMPHFPEAAVSYDSVAPRLRVFYRGLGGDAGVEIKSAIGDVSHHRLSRRLRLGMRAERIARARFDGDYFYVPASIDMFPDRDLNTLLYFWLSAWTVAGASMQLELPSGPFSRDCIRIAHAARATKVALDRFPGLGRLYAQLSASALSLRPPRRLPEWEAYIETCIRELLGAPSPTSAIEVILSKLAATPFAGSEPRDYRTFLPVPLWGEIEAQGSATSRQGQDDNSPGPAKRGAADSMTRRARRRPADQIERKGGFFVHRFEKILTWTEFMNLHRDVEDNDEESARKAADDHEEIGAGKLERKAATKLKMDLDLAPQDVDREALSSPYTYPEWDWRRGSYLQDHVRVLEEAGGVPQEGEGWKPGPMAARRIRVVRRQFEALRPRREIVARQLDGQELDLDEVIRSRAEFAARGEGTDRIYRQAREQARDLSVAVLIDVSRSTESFVEDRTVIDIEREALVALSEGLEACGDEAAIYSFSSLRRDRVFTAQLKDFSEKSGAAVRSRIGALRPGFYTRLGAAIRHTSASLARRPSCKKLLLVLTDGKPNDLDHYEGRYGVEDTRRAIMEARRMGQSVFGITIDNRAQSYFPHMFGAAGFAILSRPSRLTAALPALYRHVVS